MAIFEELDLSQDNLKAAIQAIITAMMDSIMNHILYDELFNKKVHWAKDSLYGAFVPDEIFKGSHFEKHFFTLFDKTLKSLAIVAASQGVGHGETDKRINGIIKEERLRRISEILNRLEFKGKGKNQRVQPNWNDELGYILAGGGENIPVTITADVYTMNTRSGERLAFELETLLPNSNITKVSKEKLLKLHAMEPKQVDGAYFALPYNPYQTRTNHIRNFPARWFDMQQDAVVLIGDEFWERIGGIETYKAFIDAVNEIGPEYKSRIYREYLGVEPLNENIEGLL